MERGWRGRRDGGRDRVGSGREVRRGIERWSGSVKRMEREGGKRE